MFRQVSTTGEISIPTVEMETVDSCSIGGGAVKIFKIIVLKKSMNKLLVWIGSSVSPDHCPMLFILNVIMFLPLFCILF